MNSEFVYQLSEFPENLELSRQLIGVKRILAAIG